MYKNIKAILCAVMLVGGGMFGATNQADKTDQVKLDAQSIVDKAILSQKGYQQTEEIVGEIAFFEQIKTLINQNKIDFTKIEGIIKKSLEIVDSKDSQQSNFDSPFNGLSAEELALCICLVYTEFDKKFALGALVTEYSAINYYITNDIGTLREKMSKIEANKKQVDISSKITGIKKKIEPFFRKLKDPIEKLDADQIMHIGSLANFACTNIRFSNCVDYISLSKNKRLAD